MTSPADLFKLGLYGGLLLTVAFIEGRTDTFFGSEGRSSAAAPAPVQHYSWVQQSHARFENPQDSPWLWLEEKPKPQSKQISQSNTPKNKEEAVVKQHPTVRSQTIKEERSYREATPAERQQMMEDMRQFRLEKHQQEQADPVRL